MEFFEAHTELAFPWNYLGYTQSYYLPLIQWAEYGSVYGISFWVVSINCLLFALWYVRPGKKLRTGIIAALVALFVIPLIHGLITEYKGHPAAAKVKISLLQGNIDPFEKWDESYNERNFAVYESMMRHSGSDLPDLFIWPETAAPFFLRYETGYLSRVRACADSLKRPILTGALGFNYDEQGKYHYYNAALLINPDDPAIQIYYKTKLVPFSERVPYRDYFPFKYVKNWLFDMAIGIGDYSIGNEYTLFRFSQVQPDKRELKIGSPICYESVFPDIVRQFVLQGSDVLAVITNDAWFGRTSAPYQHAQIAVLRAIENRIAIARCANTGVSCFIDPYGRVSQPTRIFEPAIASSSIPLRQKTTFFTRHGNVFAQAASIISCFVFIISFFHSSQKTGRNDLGVLS
jgi:apolipoprotein N-acyltransferase